MHSRTCRTVSQSAVLCVDRVSPQSSGEQSAATTMSQSTHTRTGSRRQYAAMIDNRCPSGERLSDGTPTAGLISCPVSRERKVESESPASKPSSECVCVCMCVCVKIRPRTSDWLHREEPATENILCPIRTGRLQPSQGHAANLCKNTHTNIEAQTYCIHADTRDIHGPESGEERRERSALLSLSTSSGAQRKASTVRSTPCTPASPSSLQASRQAPRRILRAGNAAGSGFERNLATASQRNGSGARSRTHACTSAYRREEKMDKRGETAG